MSTATALLFLITGLVLGLACGFLLGARRHPPEPAPDFKPVARALRDMRDELDAISKQQALTSNNLAGQVQAIGRTSARLQDRTDQLITALRSPQTRGRWGEVQLERVVELGGMLEHVDFEVQEHVLIDGSAVRPDMVIRLTQDRRVVVDAKVPFGAYLDALNTDDPEERQAYLNRQVNLLRHHVDTLSSKRYLEAFQPTPEFVVLFVPADPFLDAALAVDPELLEYAFARGVAITTPTTLFALLRTVALGWRQESLAQSAQEIQRLGSELHHRLSTMAEHYNRVGTSLEKAVEAYNATLASMDSRVMVTARKLEQAQVPASSKAAPELHHVSARARRFDG